MEGVPEGCARRFKVGRLLAEGGFGAVFEATQIDLGRRVALKLLKAQAFNEGGNVVERFLREARGTAALTHPNVVLIVDHGVDDGVPWIAYEFCPGGTLAELIRKERLEWKRALLIARQICLGLEAAHAANILHRDIKPQNVLFSDSGLVKIADFGLAQWNVDATILTATGAILGTPHYMAPELLKNESGPASDQYALGAMMFEMLAGRRMFDANTPVQLLMKHANAPRPTLAEAAPELPAELDELVQRMVARDPNARFESMLAVRVALEDVLPESYGTGGMTVQADAAELYEQAVQKQARSGGMPAKPGTSGGMPAEGAASRPGASGGTAGSVPSKPGASGGLPSRPGRTTSKPQAIVPDPATPSRPGRATSKPQAIPAEPGPPSQPARRATSKPQAIPEPGTPSKPGRSTSRTSAVPETASRRTPVILASSLALVGLIAVAAAWRAPSAVQPPPSAAASLAVAAAFEVPLAPLVRTWAECRAERDKVGMVGHVMFKQLGPGQDPVAMKRELTELKKTYRALHDRLDAALAPLEKPDVHRTALPHAVVVVAARLAAERLLATTNIDRATRFTSRMANDADKEFIAADFGLMINQEFSRDVLGDVDRHLDWLAAIGRSLAPDTQGLDQTAWALLDFLNSAKQFCQTPISGFAHAQLVQRERDQIKFRMSGGPAAEETCAHLLGNLFAIGVQGNVPASAPLVDEIAHDAEALARLVPGAAPAFASFPARVRSLYPPRGAPGATITPDWPFPRWLPDASPEGK